MPERENLPSEENIKEILAPSHLQPEQNFYDQFPFREEFANEKRQFTLRTGVQLDDMDGDLGYGISSLVQFLTQKGKLEKDISVEIGTFIQQQEIYPLRERKSLYNFDNGLREFQRSIKNVVSSLDNQWPKWKTYISAKKDNSLYKHDGTYFLKANKPSFPQSYLVWLQEDSNRAARRQYGLTIQAVAETFPQQAGMAKTRSDVMRTWSIQRTGGLDK